MAKSWRPISLSRVLSKVWTRMLAKRVTAIAAPHSDPQQHAYKAAHGCETALFCIDMLLKKATEFGIVVSCVSIAIK